jgi:hypothetical protein
MVSRENPTDFDSRLRLAEIYEQTGRKEEALEVISAGTLSTPPNPSLISHSFTI